MGAQLVLGELGGQDEPGVRKHSLGALHPLGRESRLCRLLLPRHRRPGARRLPLRRMRGVGVDSAARGRLLLREAATAAAAAAAAPVHRRGPSELRAGRRRRIAAARPLVRVRRRRPAIRAAAQNQRARRRGAAEARRRRGLLRARDKAAARPDEPLQRARVALLRGRSARRRRPHPPRAGGRALAGPRACCNRVVEASGGARGGRAAGALLRLWGGRASALAASSGARAPDEAVACRR
mmetsp:Transcript_19961/g.63594  ORF Transcript_19961/g.63594 Transcript_19961/m.63594 type:complete len:239 (+) Transcript_19961:951-1667(+)